jgi:hypothetical protein
VVEINIKIKKFQLIDIIKFFYRFGIADKIPCFNRKIGELSFAGVGPEPREFKSQKAGLKTSVKANY